MDAARDAGLVRAVGPLGLAASIVNSVVGAGIFVIPAAMAAGAGSQAPLAFLACGLGMGAIVLCFAEGGRRVPTSGGPYGYIEAAFGPVAGFVAGTLLWVGNVLACGSVAAALGDGAASVLPPVFATAVHAVVILCTLGVVAAINVRGVASGARFVGFATAVKLVPLFVFIVAGAMALNRANLAAAAPPSVPGFGRAMILAVFAFTGMEISLSASGEVARPARTIPRALITAMTFVTVLYVSIQVIAQGMLGSSLPGSPAPLAEAMGRIHPLLRLLLLVGATVSMFAWLGSDVLGAPRMLFAFARDGLLPSGLGRLHPRTHAPYVAILCYAAIAALLALTGTFAELAVLATLAIAALYLAGCASVWLLARRSAATGSPEPALRWLNVAAAVGVASMLLVIALATWTEIAGLGATVAISVLAYGLRHWLRRNRAHP